MYMYSHVTPSRAQDRWPSPLRRLQLHWTGSTLVDIILGRLHIGDVQDCISHTHVAAEATVDAAARRIVSQFMLNYPRGRSHLPHRNRQIAGAKGACS